MNCTAEHEMLNRYSLFVDSASVRLAKIKKDAKKVSVLKAASSNTLDLHESMKQRLVDLKLLQKIVKAEEIAFKERRLNFISGSITEQLEYIFPKKGLRANVSCNFERNNMRLRLTLSDPENSARPPYLTEGKFAQQLISFSAAAACTSLLSRNILYLDESFSNASQDNLEKTQHLLKSHVDKGFQIILISQSSVLFNDLPRREIHLISDDGKFVNSVEYKDFNMEGGVD